MIDGVIQAAAGLLATLIGFRVIRFPASNYQRWHDQWGKYLRIAGPLLILIGLTLALLESGAL